MSIAAASRKVRQAHPDLLLRVLVLLAVLPPVVGCNTVPPVVKVGLVGPFEGRHRAVGYDVIYSARMAIRKANTNNDTDRYRYALVALDDFGDPDIAREIAESLVLDPAVVAVVGHWLPDTTAAALPIYEEAGMPFIQTGEAPFGESDPARLPDWFLEDYAGLTPFDEIAGSYAGAGYDSISLFLAAASKAFEVGRSIDRRTVGAAIEDMEYSGITGMVFKR